MSLVGPELGLENSAIMLYKVAMKAQAVNAKRKFK
jgi:hypothetical protein